MTETTTFSAGDMDPVCNQLDMTLSGLDEAPEGVDSDGYQAAYTYDLTNDLVASDLQMTCFGFDDDPVGYFCVGVVGQEFTENEYAGHGAGYWTMSAAQLAEKSERLGARDGDGDGETGESEDYEAQEDVETFSADDCEYTDFYDPDSACYGLD